MPSYVGYARTSTQDQSISCHDQKERIEKYAQSLGWSYSQTLVDEGVSSRTAMRKRPAGKKLFEAIAQGEVTGIIILKLDRAWRSVIEALTEMNSLEKMGVELVVLDMGGSSFNTNSSTGKLLISIISCLAQWERDVISERTSSALQYLKSQGRRVSGKIPYGYDLSDDGKHVTPNPLEQEAIELMVSLRAKGHSYQRIVLNLVRRGYQPKYSLSWSSMTVRNIVLRYKNQ